MAFPSRSANSYAPVSLPLQKLSFCTNATLHTKPRWEQFAGEVDLYAVFDSVKNRGLGGGVSEKQLLKLVRKGDLLEAIDLENLVYQAGVDDERIRSQQIQDSNRSVVLMIKNPFVALRYQLFTGEFRRLQMNFQHESGYDVAVRIFLSLGLPIQDMNGTVPRSRGSGSGSVSPTHFQPTQPYPSISEGTQMRTESYPESNGLYHAGPPSLGKVPSFERPSSASNLAYQGALVNPVRGPSGSFGNPLHNMAVFGSQGFLGNPLSNERATTAYGYALPPSSAPERVLDRPGTAPISISQIMPPTRELPFKKQPSNLDTDQVVREVDRSKAFHDTDSQITAKVAKNRGKAKAKRQTSRPSSSRAKPRPASKQGLAKEAQQPRVPAPGFRPGDLVMPEPFIGGNLPNNQTNAAQFVAEIGQGKAKEPTARPSSSRAKSRPVSRQAPAKEQLVPPAPARILRSQVSATSDTVIGDTSPTEKTIAKEQPPPLAPGPSLKLGDRDTSDVLVADNSPSKQANNDRMVADDDKGKAKEQISRPSSSRTKTKSATKAESAKEKPLPPAPGPKPGSRVSTSSDILVGNHSPPKKTTTKRPITEASQSQTNTRKKTSAAVQKPPTFPEQSSKDLENIPPEDDMARTDRDLLRPKTLFKPTSTNKDQLAAYAAQPEDERLVALDSMICDYLDDENFVKLVEDMDKTWRRIGLGF